MDSEHDFVNALLDYFVAPMLPLKDSGREVPLHQQQLVAVQIHAVVVLYNYYHRKQCDGMKFLGFQDFSNLAAILKPTLMAHMKPNVDDTVTVKAIKDACDLCRYLDDSKEVPNVEGWPVSGVAVLVTDSEKQNCLLQLNSTTQGVWSLIEKSLDDLPVDFDGKMDSSRVSKRQKIAKKMAIDASNVDEAMCLQLALKAVKETAGINPSDLVVMESHIVYSLSKAKTTVRFYIMQTNQSLGEDVQISIEQILDSMQGPLVTKSSSMWAVTPVVEYFHVLPYAAILAEWFSRNEMQDQHMDVGSPRGMDVLCDNEPIIVEDDVPIESSTETNTVSNLEIRSSTAPQKQKDNEALNISNSSAGPQEHFSAEVDCNGKLSKKKEVAPINTILRAPVVESGNEKLGAETNQTLYNQIDVIEVPPVTLDSKQALARADLTTLFKRRSRLCSQRQAIEKEIVACDQKIQESLDGLIGQGGDVHDKKSLQHLEHQELESDGKLLSESVLCLSNSCQLLDEMCHENNWSMPRYNVKSSAGGFTAHVNVKGTGFECSTEGDVHSSSPLAMGSAAKRVLAKLLDLSGQNP